MKPGRPIAARRCAGLLLAALLLAAAPLSACGGPKSNLVPEDFCVWQNGEAVYTPAQFNGLAFRFADTGRFEPALISTWRGICLGDGAQKLADAYKNTRCSAYRVAFTNEEYERYAELKDYGAVMAELANYPDYWVYYEMWLINGKPRYDTQDVLALITGGKLSRDDQFQWYQLGYLIEDGRVCDIELSVMDFTKDALPN